MHASDPDVAIDLESVEELFAAVKVLHGNGARLPLEDDRRMSQAFDKHANAVLSRLNSRAGDLQYQHDKQAETLMAKHGIYDVCFQEIIS